MLGTYENERMEKTHKDVCTRTVPATLFIENLRETKTLIRNRVINYTYIKTQVKDCFLHICMEGYPWHW